uniref:Uncharacterized protein n=1 Tax=Pararge aegeria TaxID=116150 RepID=S4PRW9_9NEOP
MLPPYSCCEYRAKSLQCAIGVFTCPYRRALLQNLGVVPTPPLNGRLSATCSVVSSCLCVSSQQRLRTSPASAL